MCTFLQYASVTICLFSGLNYTNTHKSAIYAFGETL